jgi:hypothetical protein
MGPSASAGRPRVPTGSSLGSDVLSGSRRDSGTMTTLTQHSSSSAPSESTESPARPSLVRAGGVAAQVVAGTYVVGFLAMGAYLVPRGFVDPVADPEGSLAFLLDHQAPMSAWYALLYLVGGAALVLVSLGLRDRLAGAPGPARVSAALGMVWSGLLVASGSIAVVGQQAVVALHADDPTLALGSWTSVSIVQDALGGGIEVAGALWAAVVGYAVLRTRALPAALGGLALGLAVTGLVTLLPFAAETATSVFGLGFIVWFTWAGVVLARR